MATESLTKYLELKEKQEQELNALKEAARSDLVRQISVAKEVLETLNQKHIELTGTDLQGRPPGWTETPQKKKGAGQVKADFGDESELEQLLKRSPGHKLNRKGLIAAGYNLPSAIAIAKSHPKKFGQSQTPTKSGKLSSQGEVWLLKNSPK